MPDRVERQKEARSRASAGTLAGSNAAAALAGQNFRDLAHDASDVIMVSKADGVVVYASPAVERVLGYAPAELEGRSAFEHCHPEDVDGVAAAFSRLVAGAPGGSSAMAFRHLHKHGGWRALEATAINLLHDPEVGGVVTHLRERSPRPESSQSLPAAVSAAGNWLDLYAQQTVSGVVEFDPEFKIVEWNPAAERIFGYRREQALGQDADVLFPAKARAHAHEVREHLLRSHQTVRVTQESQTGSGRILTCEWSYTPLLRPEGSLVGIVSLVNDVSERRAGEDALRRSEERYRLLFERNLAGVYWSTAEGELVDCNESFARMFGYRSRSEMMTQRTIDFYEHFSEREKILAQLRERRTLTNVESFCRRQDGSPLWVLQNLSFIDDGSGAPMIQGTMIEITERKFAEQNLRQAEGRFRSIFENAAEGIFQTSLEGRWVIANPKLAQILGYASPQELIADTGLRDRYYADPNRRREMVRRLEREGAIYGVESQVRRKDGEVIWVSESSRSVRDPHGHLVGFEGTVQDVTERRHAEEALRQNERRLRKQNEMLVELSQRKTIESGDLEKAVLEVTEAVAETLETEFASVWLLNEDRTRLRCINQYQRSTRTHSSGQDYAVVDYPAYFEALDVERTVDADNALTDPRTAPFATTLAAQGVVSLLDSVVRVGGEVVGVLSHEHTGQPRSWTLDEKNFAGSVADLLSLAIEAEQRLRAQEALRESESKFRAVAETAASAIYIHDGQRFVFCNRASEVISGYSRDELMAMDPFALVHPGDQALVRERARARLQGAPEAPRYEYRILTKQGETRWLDFSASMISFAGQTAVLGTAFDITERKRGEQLQAALYRIAERASFAHDLDEFFRAIHAILAGLMYARNFYIALFDPRSQMLAFPYFVDEQEPPPPPQKLGKGLTEYVLRTGQPYLNSPELEQQLAARGEVELVGAPSVDWLGVPLKTGSETFGVLALQSYTENERFGEREKEILAIVSQSVASALQRKRDEDALRRSEARYRSQVQSAVYGIYRSSVQGKFLTVNPALVSMLGYDSVEDVLALDIALDVYADPSQRSRLVNEYRNADRIQGVEVHWMRKDRKPITVRLSGRTLRNEPGEPEGFEMLAEDITARHTLEEQLRQSQKMEAVGRLAGGVAHDFNNLLTVIKGYSELMLDQLQQGDPMKPEVEEVKKAADRAAALTRQLLAFSRKQVLEPRVLDLNSVVSNMEKLLRRLIGEDVQLVTSADPQLGRAKADPGQTEQVIMNLAVNARDAMPAGGKLTIATSNVTLERGSLPQHEVTPGEYVRIDVSDTGTGMDAATQSRIFEPFFTTKEQGKGTGLGLSTVYGIVKQSGGYVEVQSELGKGTTFSIYLPRVQEGERPAAAPAAVVRQVKGDETILIVEDEDGVRTLARQILQKQGYTVLDTSHGGEALLVCERHQGAIHLLLTDVVLAQIGGRELAERLLRLRPQMKVLYMSGYSGDAVEQHGVLDLGTAFLQKPFNTESLITKVRQVLDSPPAAAPSVTPTVQ